MARPVTYTKQLAPAIANSVAGSQTPVSGTPLTINGTAASGGVATLDTQRQIVVNYGVEAAQRTMTLTGATDTGAQISETLTIPSGASGTVATQQSFRTVTLALPGGGGWSAAVTVGTNTTGSTPWVLMDEAISNFNLSLAAILTGTATYSIEFAMESPLARVMTESTGGTFAPQPGFPPTPYSPTANPNLSGLTATLNPTGWTMPVAAVRTTITSGAGSVRSTFTQAGIRD